MLLLCRGRQILELNICPMTILPNNNIHPQSVSTAQKFERCTENTMSEILWVSVLFIRERSQVIVQYTNYLQHAKHCAPKGGDEQTK